MAVYDIKVRDDRIGRYFKKYLNKYVFTEFGSEFLTEAGLVDIMKGVPIPLRSEDVKNFSGGDGLPMLRIAENMGRVMGCDPHFKYARDYIKCINRLYDYKFAEKLVAVGKKAASEGDTDDACICFRGALCMVPEDMDAMYSYGRICRAMYLNNNNEEYIGRFKAEALDLFELLTELHPEFAQGHYYLGYAYLNMGLYKKSEIVWKTFLKLTKESKEKKEIKARLDQLKDPVRVEQGCNDIASGRYEDGMELLEPFAKTGYKQWWPLWYYLGIGYVMTGSTDEAEESFKKVLRINASHIETMKELTNIYADRGDQENLRKYQQKIALVEAGIEEDMKQTMDEVSAGDRILVEEEPEKGKPEIIEDLESKQKKHQHRRKETKQERDKK